LCKPSGYAPPGVGAAASFLAPRQERVAAHLRRSADRQAPSAYGKNGSRACFYLSIGPGSACLIGFVRVPDRPPLGAR
jgi:hypothetical protein